MRFGVVSDIHGNLHALDAALTKLARTGVDGYLCAGDLVGYGPMPNECVARLADLGASCIVGNHDLIALGRLSDVGCSELARKSLEWTREELSIESRRFLGDLPSVRRIPGGVVVAHGSLEDPSEYVKEPEQREEQLKVLERLHPAAFVLVLGHTHRPIAHARRGGTVRPRWRRSLDLLPDETYVLNPGSVGQSRERAVRARCLVLDLESRQVSFHAVRYDVSGCRRALRARGLPTWSMHLNPSPLRRYAGALRRRAGAV
jgi:predicted phosphodiesterase